MTRRATLPDGLPHTFRVSEALALGATRNRLGANDLVAHFRGSRMSTQPLLGANGDEERANLIRRCAAYLPVAPAGIRFSHTTAARIYEMPLPPMFESQPALHVSVDPEGSLPRARGIRGHRSAKIGRGVIDGLPVVSPEVAWLQLASVLAVDDVVVAGDYLIRRKTPLSSLGLIAGVAADAAGERGVRRARLALSDIRQGTDSPMESRMRLIIVRSGLPEPVIGHTVIDPDGFFVGTPDLAYVAERIAIEYEGDHHRANPHVFREDIERREGFERIDWRVLRVTHDHIRQPWRLVDRVRELLARRAPSS